VKLLFSSGIARQFLREKNKVLYVLFYLIVLFDLEFRDGGAVRGQLIGEAV
jgi:hypothetical protein